MLQGILRCCSSTFLPTYLPTYLQRNGNRIFETLTFFKTERQNEKSKHIFCKSSRRSKSQLLIPSVIFVEKNTKRCFVGKLPTHLPTYTCTPHILTRTIFNSYAIAYFTNVQFSYFDLILLYYLGVCWLVGTLQLLTRAVLS